MQRRSRTQTDSKASSARCLELHGLHLGRRIWGFQGKSVASGAAGNRKPALPQHHLHPTRHIQALWRENVAPSAVRSRHKYIAPTRYKQAPTQPKDCLTRATLMVDLTSAGAASYHSEPARLPPTHAPECQPPRGVLTRPHPEQVFIKPPSLP